MQYTNCCSETSLFFFFLAVVGCMCNELLSGRLGQRDCFFLARVNKKLRSACPISHSLPLSITPHSHILIPCLPLSLSTPSATCVFLPSHTSFIRHSTISTSSSTFSLDRTVYTGFGLFRNKRNISEAKNGSNNQSRNRDRGFMRYPIQIGYEGQMEG